MATTAQIIDRFAQPTGLLPSTLDRVVRSLQVAKLVLSGGRGGGKSSAHQQIDNMANILMGLAGPLPSDAPEAVRLLRRMVPEDADATPFPNFGAYVEHLIKEAAAPRSIVGSVSNPYRLVMCFNPPLAYREESRGQSHTFFSPTWGGKLPEMYRVTHISSNLIATAAGLAADQGKSASTQLPFPAVSSASASTGNEDGDALPGAPPFIGNQSARANGSGTVNSPDSTLKAIDFKSARAIASLVKSKRRLIP